MDEELKTVIVNIKELRIDFPEAWTDEQIAAHLDHYLAGTWIDFKYEEDWRN